MSLKRRTKIQHANSPKSSIQKQIDQDMRLNTKIHNNKENSTQQYLLNKMQQKISKILISYQRLEDQCKKKDDLIKELEKQNMLLKQRLVEVSTEKASFQARTHSRRQPFQEHVVQRTFTPSDIKKQVRLQSHKPNLKVTDFSSPVVSIVRQYDPKTQMNRMLKESRSLENLNKTAVTHVRAQSRNTIVGTVNDEDNKIFSKRDENRMFREEIEEDRSFIDVLGKLKEKIRKFDQQQEAQNTRKTIQKEQKPMGQPLAYQLNKVKSTQNISRRQFSFMDKPEQVQTQTLKKIWNQRDQEIKRMDELFSKIDERINVIQKQ